MRFLDSQQRAIGCAQQLVLINQLDPRVDVVFVHEVYCRFKSMAVQVVHFSGTAHVVAPPDESRGPVTTLEWQVVLYGGSTAPDIGSRLSSLRPAQETVAHLHRPILVGRKRK